MSYFAGEQEGFEDEIVEEVFETIPEPINQLDDVRESVVEEDTAWFKIEAPKAKKRNGLGLDGLIDEDYEDEKAGLGLQDQDERMELSEVV